MSHLFNAYAKAVNKAFGRVGSLFQRPFKRIPVTEQRYFQTLVCYIHRNPQHHGLIDDFTRWPYTSYRTLLSELPTRLHREIVLDWFGGRPAFQSAHRRSGDAPHPLFYEAPDQT